MSKREVQCLCEEVFEVEVPETLDLDVPSLVNEILEGRFQSYPCPACGNAVNVELQVHFSSIRWKLELDYFPEYERNHFLSNTLKVSSPVGRISFGLKELAEKLRLLRDGWDDRAIEVLKFHFLQKEGLSDEVKLFYFQRKEGKLEFYIEGLKEKEIGITGVQETFYEKLKARLENPPEDWKAFITPPYVNVQSVRKEVY